MPVYVYRCDLCRERFEQYRPISEFADAFPCPNCGRETKRIFLPSAISISSEQTRYEGNMIAQADAQCKADQKKDADEKRGMAKTDEHWKREWHAAELHGANDGGESLKDQMRQALGSETNETEKAVFEKRIA